MKCPVCGAFPLAKEEQVKAEELSELVEAAEFLLGRVKIKSYIYPDTAEVERLEDAVEPFRKGAPIAK